MKSSASQSFEGLMTYKNYARSEQSVPYFFEVERNGQLLTYFGVEHTFDPHHEQMAKIEKAWETFLSSTKKEQSLVLIEGGCPKARASKEASIEDNGEGGLIAYLAEQAGIPTESPEPPLTYEVRELLKQFPREEILYDYFARVAAQWKRTNGDQDMLTYVKRIIAKEAQALGISEERILPTLSEAHRTIFGGELNLSDFEHFEKVCDPVNIFSVVNKVARANSILRDQYILKQIEEKWQEGKSLFIVYGATHAIMQEPALRHLVTQQ